MTRAPVALLSAMAVLSACTRERPGPTALGADSAETRALAAAGGTVERHGDTLRIAGTGKVSALLVDDTTGGEDYHILRYDGRVPGTAFHGVRMDYFEGRAYLLVHERTAKQSRLDARPLPSPSATWLATASLDLEAGFDANALEIVEPVDDTVRTVFRADPARWGPDSLAWHGDDTLLVMQRWVTDSGPGRYERREARVVRSEGRWRLEPPDTTITDAP
jgi:hypothetical protein